MEAGVLLKDIFWRLSTLWMSRVLLTRRRQNRTAVKSTEIVRL
jgi:hypothetical protein